MNILKRLYLILFAIFFVVTAGSYGYYILFRGEHNLMDCIPYALETGLVPEQ